MATSSPRIQYRVTMPEPQTHYFHVEARFEGPFDETFTVALPVWTPGSYLVRDFAKHVIHMSAWADDQPIPIAKIDKSRWQVAVPARTRQIRLNYAVYAYELTVRTSHLDDSHGYVNGATLFVYHEPWKNEPVTLSVEPPPGWTVTTALDRHPDSSGYSYHVPNYDVLVDSPLEIGPHHPHSFWVNGVLHELVVWGDGPLPLDRLLGDLTRMAEEAAALFGGLPFSRYVFILHLTDRGGGGLEHANSASVQMPRSAFWQTDGYYRALSVFAHEYFHLWNVKRLRPTTLGPFDYQQENYTTLLWALEGFTDYYAPLLLVRAGILPVGHWLKSLGESLKSLQEMPGRLVQSLAEASFDAWIQFYRPDANSPNLSVSYYHKGALAALFLDLALRRATGGQASLDTVMVGLWQRYHDTGYPPDAVDAMIVDVGGPEFRGWLDRYIYGTADWDETVLHTVGLELTREYSRPESERPVYLGLKVADKEGKLLAETVYRYGPAEQAGIAPGDEIIALDGIRCRLSDWTVRLSQYHPGAVIHVSVFRRDILTHYAVIAESPRPDQWLIKPLTAATDAERRQFSAWTHQSWPGD